MKGPLTTEGDVPVRRQVARVALLDEKGSLLLISARDPGLRDAREFWFTPGGGAEPDEALEDAARREVHEETGHVITDLGHPRWQSWASFTFEGQRYEQAETFFVVRTPRFEVRPAAWTAVEARSTTGWRWWPLDELFRTDAVVFPADLGARLGALDVATG